jgi:hypothetical protein
MLMEIPETPLAAIRAVRHILAQHRIEIGLLKIEPAALYEIMNESDSIRDIMLKFRDSDTDMICGIPFEQKRP